MFRFIIGKAYSICKKNESIPRSQKKLWQKIYYNGFKLIYIILIEFILKIKYQSHKEPFKPLIDDGIKPIISLTTFPARINSLWIVLHSIFDQTYPPAKIILVLTKDEFPQGLDILPYSVKQFMNKGLEIIFTNYNLRPHNKYFYALNRYKDRDIITVDDDLYYWPDTIERLIKLNKKYPNCVCANSVQSLYFKDEKLTLNNIYEPEKKNTGNLALGVNGVLYPTSFRSDELFNTKDIINLCLNADDLWLKAHELIIGIDVVGGSRYTTPLFVLGSQKFALRYKNVDENENEIQWQRLDKRYNISKYLNKKTIINQC